MKLKTKDLFNFIVKIASPPVKHNLAIAFTYQVTCRRPRRSVESKWIFWFRKMALLHV